MKYSEHVSVVVSVIEGEVQILLKKLTVKLNVSPQEKLYLLTQLLCMGITFQRRDSTHTKKAVNVNYFVLGDVHILHVRYVTKRSVEREARDLHGKCYYTTLRVFFWSSDVTRIYLYLKSRNS